MFIQLIEDDQAFTKLLKRMLASASDVEVQSIVRVSDLLAIDDHSAIDIFLVDVNRPDSVSFADDVKTIRKSSEAPIVFITEGETKSIRDTAIRAGADAVVDKSDISEGLIRQIALNALSRERSNLNTPVMNSQQLSRNMSALRAPLAYLESGLTTLGDVMRETGKSGSSEFIDHLRETIQAIKQYSEEDLSSQMGGSLDSLIQQSLLRIQQLAESRKISLRVDWEEAGFRHIGSDALARLGIQHLLEGVLRCCMAQDGVWMQGEKADETGASVIRVHLSRRILPTKEIMFPDAKPTMNVGLDALSSLQLGALLLMLTKEQVSLSTEERQQLLSVYL